jgi:hypothetical protein
LGDKADLELADGHAAMGAIEVCVHPRAGLQLQHLLLFVQGPDAGERRAQVLDHGLCAPLQDATQGVTTAQGGGHVRPERRLTRLTLERLLGPLALGYVVQHPDEVD